MQPLYDFFLKVILMLGLIGLIGVLSILHRYRNRLEGFKLAMVAVPDAAALVAPGRRVFKEAGRQPLVRLESGRERREGWLASLDLGGANLRCTRPFGAGTMVVLRLAEAGGGELQLVARVVWSNGHLAERNPVALALRLGFVKLTAAQRQRLQALIDSAGTGTDEGASRR